MSQVYIAYHFTINPKDVGSEILIAELGELPFDSFEDTDMGCSAYIPKNLWNKNMLDDIDILKNQDFQISYQIDEIAAVNWNEEWEKNFAPIDVDGRCYVRAPFHPKTSAEFDIVIEPKMSFGTGHHETTHMMIQSLLSLKIDLNKTLDMGCGTAILAILAEKLGAKPIDAIDIDNWCYQNSIENAERNNCKHITVYEGDASLLTTQKYDLIIANINRNILINDMTAYANCLNQNGTLLLSGFYEDDIEAIGKACTENGLKYLSKRTRNNWCALTYFKPMTDDESYRTH